jgi:long-chain acyl-CoA synthetase
MSEKMFAPDLFRPPVYFPDVAYDQLLRMAAYRNPERTAIIYHDLYLTYREVVSMVNCLANGLHDLGLRKGEKVCLFMANRPEYTVTFIAAATLGLVVSPMNPAYKDREVGYQLENAEASALVIQRDLLPVLQLVLSQKTFPHLKHIIVTGANTPESLPEALPWSKLMRSSSPDTPPKVEVTSNDLLALPYSSGTTGLPKGVMLTHRNLVSNNLQFTTALQVTNTDVALLFLPFYHIYGVMLTGSFLAAGATQVMMERFDPQLSLELSETHNVTYYFAVPPVINVLANYPLDLSKLKSVRYIFSGAAPLPLETVRRLQERISARIVEGYGMTESSPLTHSQPKDPALVRMGSVGLPTHNTEQKIVDIETGEQELPPGEDGELIIKGPQVMQGYWNAPEATAQALRNGWLYTGDIGHIDEEGYAYIVDRKKEMIKYKGFGIAPAELEALLVEHPAVMDAAVIGIPDEEAGELPKGFVVLRPGQTTTPDEIIAFVNGKLAGYKKLSIVEIITAIPKNASGKILRKDLKEQERLKALNS